MAIIFGHDTNFPSYVLAQGDSRMQPCPVAQFSFGVSDRDINRHNHSSGKFIAASCTQSSFKASINDSLCCDYASEIKFYKSGANNYGDGVKQQPLRRVIVYLKI